MTTSTLNRRQLNRATLARQWLLERVEVSPLEASEHLLGLQAQLPAPPFIGLWTRLHHFHRRALLDLLHQRKIVRATLMRATLHLVSAADYVRFRPALQPALARSLQSFFRRGGDPAVQTAVLEAARSLLQEGPSTFAVLRQRLAERFPELEPAYIAYLVRMQLPLVQVPDQGAWGFSNNPHYAVAFDWLREEGEPWPPEEGLRLLVRRYLAAFGPASLNDLQTWSGLGNLKPVLRSMRAELHLYRDEQGQELFDLPDQPLPPADRPAPVRFLPDFDNVLLAYARRERILPASYRQAVLLPPGRVLPTILVDGFVAGIWTIQRQQGHSKLLITPFTTLSADQGDELLAEGERLLTFLAPQGEAGQSEVQILRPS
ncbi:winged helix DNA-binding domain-containing protein [Thermogemmatispora carboxidivorans]|uniref:winged helix DNA-binding domain-containing protein n=1 Tax=Thermogemmatispora carboxidivorans TaxID=1382306 RepID=UPI00069BDB19|nr:winged helix DNA-binding domain-containing protein [Thermogemmatispora carboxidivorans]